MKKIIFPIIAMLLSIITTAKNKEGDKQADSLVKVIQRYDSLLKSLKYEYGTITLSNGIGKIVVPAGFKYLSGPQAEMVLTELWGNPKSTSLGMILPENQNVMSDSGYIFNIEYDDIGYVKDNDADDIKYDQLLAQMQAETIEGNTERQRQGYEDIDLIGWAATPYYDKERKILHWAKELKFGKDSSEHTLNYNVRILGRKGVLILNAISTMPNLAMVKNDIPKVLNIVQFNEGYQYKDFDSNVDNVAAWTIGGLVAGKILAKVGFFAIILKFGKVIALAVIGFFSLIWKRIKNKRDQH